MAHYDQWQKQAWLKYEHEDTFQRVGLACGSYRVWGKALLWTLDWTLSPPAKSLRLIYLTTAPASSKMGHQDRNWLKSVGQRMPSSGPPSLFPSCELPAFPPLSYSLCSSLLLHKLKTMPGSRHGKARGMVSCRHGYHPRTGMCAINHLSRL